MKLSSGEAGDLGELLPRSCSKELGWDALPRGCWGRGTQQMHHSPTCSDSGSRKFAGKCNFKILICGGASLYCSLVSCPVSLLLVSAVGLLEGRES